jgi:hypothetical protein
MTMTGGRHRTPSRLCHLEREMEVVTVAQLLEVNQRQLPHQSLWSRLLASRRGRTGVSRLLAMIPQPRTATE